jgi:hypothetical protein
VPSTTLVFAPVAHTRGFPSGDFEKPLCTKPIPFEHTVRMVVSVNSRPHAYYERARIALVPTSVFA